MTTSKKKLALILAVALIILVGLLRILLMPPPSSPRISPPTPQYYLTVISPYGTPGGEGWYDECTTAYATLDTSIVDHGNATRRVFTHWSGDASGTTTTSDPIHMDQNKTAIADWKTQYLVTFNHTGLDATATGTVVTVNGSAKTFINLPFSMWVDSGGSINYSYGDIVSSIETDKRFKLVNVTGPTSPITVTSPATVTGNYKTLYEVTFSQSGVATDFTGTVVTIDGTGYNVTNLPVSFWWDAGSVHNFAFQSPLTVSPNGKRYLWTSTAGLSTLQSGSITVSMSGSVIGHYKTQYYLTVTSLYDSPIPTSGWFDAGTSITASVTSPWLEPTDTRYVCIGWTGTGSVPPSGTATTVTFTINAASSITWNWKTQYLLVVRTDPTGLSPQPTREPPGEAGSGWWYDSTTSVRLTAQPVTNYDFLYWDVDGISQGSKVNLITVLMDGPHTATAHYQAVAPPPAVGGYAAPIDIGIGKEASHLLASQIGLAFALLAAMAVTIMLIRRRNKTLNGNIKDPKL